MPFSYTHCVPRGNTNPSKYARKKKSLRVSNLSAFCLGIQSLIRACNKCLKKYRSQHSIFLFILEHSYEQTLEDFSSNTALPRREKCTTDLVWFVQQFILQHYHYTIPLWLLYILTEMLVFTDFCTEFCWRLRNPVHRKQPKVTTQKKIHTNSPSQTKELKHYYWKLFSTYQVFNNLIQVIKNNSSTNHTE